MTKLDKLEQRIKELERKVCCKTQFFNTVGDLPAVGSTGVIYVTDDGNIYVWNGVEYVLNGLGDAYYTNSYVERLKALGSPVQYSNYIGSSFTNTVMTDGRLTLTSVFIPKTSTITNIGWRVGTAQGNYTADNYNGIGIYSMNITTGDLTLLTKTADDGAVWSFIAINSYGNKDFESSITLNKGIYFLAYLYNSSAVVTAPTLAVPFSTTLPQSTNAVGFNVPTNTYLGGYIESQTILPLTILGTDVIKTVPTTALDYIHYLS